jgi:hypothetical protein
METIELKKLLREIGDSVHSMNTIAVGLSKLNCKNCDIPEGLDISWEPKKLDISKIKARNYAEKAAIIYSVESFFEYLKAISENAFWIHPEINFEDGEKKSNRVFNFLEKIPKISDEMKILAELACHWRNKIVHDGASKAKLSNEKIGILRKLKDCIYENYYHFDINVALENYENKRITLKDASTLITILIKTSKLIDEFFFTEFSLEISMGLIIKKLNEQENFKIIVKQQNSDKKARQITTFIQMTYPFLKKNEIDAIIDELNIGISKNLTLNKNKGSI